MLSGALPGPCCNMLEWFINQQHVGSIACLHSPTYVSCSWDCNKPIENSIFLCFTFINNRSWDEISTFGPCNRFALQHASKTLFNMDPKSQVKTSKRSFPSEKETIGGGHLEKWYIMMNHKRNWDSDRNETAWGVEGRGDGVNIMLYLRNSTYGPIGQTIWQLYVSPSWFSLAGAPTISARLHPPSPSQILWLLPWHTDNEQPWCALILSHRYDRARTTLNRTTTREACWTKEPAITLTGIQQGRPKNSSKAKTC